METHGASIGLDTNTSIVTLQPGVYLVFGQVPSYNSNMAAYLKDTNGSIVMRGSIVNGNNDTSPWSLLQGPIVIIGGAKSIELWSRINSGSGLGLSAGFAGVNEQFSDITFIRIK